MNTISGVCGYLKAAYLQ